MTPLHENLLDFVVTPTAAMMVGGMCGHALGRLMIAANTRSRNRDLEVRALWLEAHGEYTLAAHIRSLKTDTNTPDQ